MVNLCAPFGAETSSAIFSEKRDFCFGFTLIQVSLRIGLNA